MEQAELPREVIYLPFEDGPFRMLATTLEADPYLGRVLTGRIRSGSVRPNQRSIIKRSSLAKSLAFCTRWSGIHLYFQLNLAASWM